MKKLVSGCIAVSMVLGMMAGSTAMAADDALDNIKERGKLSVATDAAWPPFEYMEGENVVGVDLDIAKDIADGKGVPAHDPRLAYLPDVPPYAQMNMALEWLLGWSYRVKCLVFPPEKPSAGELRFQDNPDFAAFTAWNVRLWTAFIPGLIFLWLVLLRTPTGLAFAGGMLHAVAAAAI